MIDDDRPNANHAALENGNIGWYYSILPKTSFWLTNATVLFQ